LNDPEAVKLFIARNPTWSNGHRILAAYAYNEYAEMKNIEWTIPKHKRDETLPFMLIEKEINHKCGKAFIFTNVRLDQGVGCW
jgi:hypothetical protein